MAAAWLMWSGPCLITWLCSSRTNKALADSLDLAVDPRDPLVNRLLRMMATTAMSQALYFSTSVQTQDQYYHYGTLTHPVITTDLFFTGVSTRLKTRR